MSELDEIRDEVVQFWAQMAPFWAMTPAAARLHALLLTQTAAMDAEELMSGLALSRGAVSMAAKELREWGLLIQEKAPGTRKVLYRAETDWETAIRAIAENRRRREWGPIEQRAADWADRLKRERTSEAREVRDRLVGIHALVAAANESADALLKGRTVKGLGMRLLLSRVLKRQRKKH